MEVRAGDQRPELDARRRGGDRRQQRPRLPRTAGGPVLPSIEEVLADPHGVEPEVLDRPGHVEELGPADLALDLGQLDADLERAAGRGGRHRSKRSGRARGRRRVDKPRTVESPTLRRDMTATRRTTRPSRSPSGPPRPDLARPTGADHQPETPRQQMPRAFSSSPKGDPVDPALALRGFVLGFTIAAAVGPISLLVIRRTLAEGQRYGLVSGLGVATADATYGAIAAFGLSADHGRPRQRPAGPRPGRRRLPAVAGLADDPVHPDRGGDRHDGAPRIRRARTSRSSV